MPRTSPVWATVMSLLFIEFSSGGQLICGEAWRTPPERHRARAAVSPALVRPRMRLR